MEKKRILIDVPSRARDSLGMVYLKLLLQRKGFEVRLEEGILDNFFTLWRFKPHALILGQEVEIQYVMRIRYAKAMGADVIVLRTEGTFTKESVSSICDKRYLKNFGLVNMELVWGETFRTTFLENSGMPPQKVIVTGCPRFDIYKPPLSRLMLTRAEFCRKHGLDPKKKIVVYTSNLVFAAVDPEHAKDNINYLEEYELLMKKRKTELAQRKIISGHFVRLAKDTPHVQFVQKLHPLEDPEYHIKLFKEGGLHNITLIKNEDIWNVINACDVLLHTHSTASTEAWFLNKPTIMLAFLEEEKQKFTDLVRGGDIVSDYTEMKETITRYLDGGRIPENTLKKRRKFIREWYYNVDGRSTERCVEAIKRFMSEREQKPRRFIGPHFWFSVLTYDLKSLIKSFIYTHRTTRHLYLRLRWKKSAEALKIIDKDYEPPFHKLMALIERRIRAIV